MLDQGVGILEVVLALIGGFVDVNYLNASFLGSVGQLFSRRGFRLLVGNEDVGLLVRDQLAGGCKVGGGRLGLVIHRVGKALRGDVLQFGIVHQLGSDGLGEDDVLAAQLLDALLQLVSLLGYILVGLRDVGVQLV